MSMCSEITKGDLSQFRYPGTITVDFGQIGKSISSYSLLALGCFMKLRLEVLFNSLEYRYMTAKADLTSGISWFYSITAIYYGNFAWRVRFYSTCYSG